MVIPNSNLFTQSVIVNTAFEKRRLQYDVGIGYGDDIARAQAIVVDALRGVHGVLPDPPSEALVVELAGSSVNIRARWWINPPLRTDVVHCPPFLQSAAARALGQHQSTCRTSPCRVAFDVAAPAGP